jgi:hypothetical protein
VDALCGETPGPPPNIWAAPGPVIPTEEERRLLAAYFDYSNRILPAVNQDKFYAALERARSYPPPAHDAAAAQEAAQQPGGRVTGTKRKAPGAGVGADAPAGPVQTAEAFGFRVLFYTLLCIGAKLGGHVCDAKRYYELARAYVGACFSYPSEHLVSALLVMAMLTRAICDDSAAKTAACHAALAARMCELVPVSPEPRMVAAIMNDALAQGAALQAEAAARAAGRKAGAPPPPPPSALEHAPMPPPVAPRGSTPESRFGDILVYVMSQLWTGFAAVDRGGAPFRASLITLMEEALELTERHPGLAPRFPLRATALGVCAIMTYKNGAVATALDLARQCIDAAAADPRARMCRPFMGVMWRLKCVLRDPAVARGDLGTATAQKSRDLTAGGE